MARTEDDLRNLLSDTESECVERKETLGGKDTKGRVCEAICAFANDLCGHARSGVIFIGATDDGRPSGKAITEDLLNELADLREQGHILPPPTMSVRKLVVDGGAVAAIEVHPSPSPPVRFKGQVWIRVGARRAIATREEEGRLSERRRSADLPFDARPIPGATIEDLDLSLFHREYLPSVVPAEVLAENNRNEMERLSSLRLATPDGVPTAAGLLLVGQEPTRHIPGAYLQFLRVDGYDLAAPILNDKQIATPLPLLLRELDDLLALNIVTAVDIGTGLKEERQPDYPLEALQQLARNAFLHRGYEGTNSPVRITWYSDRIEIHSPGGPFGSATIENFGSPGITDYRNPTLAEAMRGLGYVQRFGAGLPIARKSLHDNGNPPPEFVPDHSYVGVIIRKSS